MVQYKQLFSTLNKDGKKILVDLLQWGEATLDGDQLTQFRANMEEINTNANQLIAAGELVIEPVTKTITTGVGTTVTITIGTLYTYTNQRLDNSNYDYWQSQFAADPNVQYQPEILQG